MGKSTYEIPTVGTVPVDLLENFHQMESVEPAGTILRATQLDKFLPARVGAHAASANASDGRPRYVWTDTAQPPPATCVGAGGKVMRHDRRRTAQRAHRPLLCLWHRTLIEGATCLIRANLSLVRSVDHFADSGAGTCLVCGMRREVVDIAAEEDLVF